MSWIPSKDSESKDNDRALDSGLELAVVEGVNNDAKGIIRCQSITARHSDASDTSPYPAYVLQDTEGDMVVPKVGNMVVVARTQSGFPIVLGILYTKQLPAPSYDEDERVIGHPFSAAEIRFEADGTIVITADSGDKIAVDTTDGSVRVNDGTKKVVTDVQASGTNMNGGITGLDVTYSDDLKTT